MARIERGARYTILNTDDEIKRSLLLIEMAGRTCYRSEVDGEITYESASKFARMLIKRGHESVLEHGGMAVKFTGSRGLSHEQVRHRVGVAYSQESTRYVDYTKGGRMDLDDFEMGVILPPHRDINELISLPDGRELTPINMVNELEVYYRALRQAGWLPEEARQFLPIGLETNIVVTANWRQWRHMVKERAAKPAHSEIRGVYGKLLVNLKSIVPALFEDFEEKGVDINGLPYYGLVDRRTMVNG